MAIIVLCPGCRSRFTVSDQFAGKTGPCPKCKRSITIPQGSNAGVTIHEPEPARGGPPGSLPPTIPFRRVEERVTPLTWGLIAAGTVAMLAGSWLLGRWLPSGSTTLQALLAAGGYLVAVPCVALGYAAIRDRELEPYRGWSFLARVLICAAVYGSLWIVKGLLPPDATREMWQWLYLGPLFFLPGTLAAYATLDFDWGPAAVHFSLFVLITALLRWLAGLPPL
jgi:hypothetical protein